MAAGSGIAAQLGVAQETTYGTIVTPSRFFMPDKWDLKKVKNIAQGNGLAAGRLQMLGSRRVPTTHKASGTFTHDVVSNGMGILLQQLMGTTATVVQQAATTAYLQTHTLGLPAGKSLTVQVGIPDRTGTVRPYTYQGCKITEADFTFDMASNDPVESVWSVDAQDVTEATALAAASFVNTYRPFVNTDTAVRVGTYGSEASVTGVSKVEVKIPRELQTEAYYFGASGLQAEPITNDFTQITGTISADYIDKTIWADRFASDTGFSLVVEAIGPVIASTYRQTFRIVLPQCFLDGDTPIVDGPDVVNGDFPFSCLYDGTNLPRIEYMSTDTAV